MTDPISVIPLVAQWSFSISDTSLGGTRAFREGTHSTPTYLPKIGDAWDTEYTNVTLKSIETSYIEDNDNCGRKFICTYNGLPYTQQAIINTDLLPRTMDIGGEMRAWEPRGNLWKWASNGNVISNQNLSRRVVIVNYRMYRTVKDFNEYTVAMINIAGKINAQDFHGFPVGSVLFLGPNMSEFKNKIGATRWRAELLFSIKSCTGRLSSGVANADGWTYDLREDGNVGYINGWDRPVIPGSPDTYLYEYADFAPIFETSQLGQDENLYDPLPYQ